MKTNGQSGTASCSGPVNGKRPAGPGTSGFEGRYGTKDGDTCQGGGEGDGVLSFAIPTSGGVEWVKSNNTYDYGAFKSGAGFSGRYQGDRGSGTFDVSPKNGDCASQPVTKFNVRAKGTIKD
jgi:hypothetical protein